MSSHTSTTTRLSRTCIVAKTLCNMCPSFPGLCNRCLTGYLVQKAISASQLLSMKLSIAVITGIWKHIFLSILKGAYDAVEHWEIRSSWILPSSDVLQNHAFRKLFFKSKYLLIPNIFLSLSFLGLYVICNLDFLDLAASWFEDIATFRRSFQ
jgi:hypothetical protein